MLDDGITIIGLLKAVGTSARSRRLGQLKQERVTFRKPIKSSEGSLLFTPYSMVPFPLSLRTVVVLVTMFLLGQGHDRTKGWHGQDHVSFRIGGSLEYTAFYAGPKSRGTGLNSLQFASNRHSSKTSFDETPWGLAD